MNIESWLRAHSTAVLCSEREIVFKHPGGRHSVLLLHADYQEDVDHPVLSAFYKKFNGGFIGDGFLLIGTSDVSRETSSGLVIPTLNDIRRISIEQGIIFNEEEIPFMTTAYMFVYTFLRDGRLRCHDRDFSVVSEDQTLIEVLNDWWTIKETDGL